MAPHQMDNSRAKMSSKRGVNGGGTPPERDGSRVRNGSHQTTSRNSTDMTERTTENKGKRKDGEGSSKSKTGKSGAKKQNRLISPKMIFLKRKVRHIYRDMAADRKSPCGKTTCKNIKVFVAIYAVLFLVRGAFRQYFAGVLEHIQRHFTLSMRELEFLIGVEKIGFAIVIIFVGYYGNKMHKPVTILIGALFCSLGVILCAVPYFIELTTVTPNATDAKLYYKAGLCQIGTNSTQTSKTQCETLIQHPDESQAFSLLATGNFLVGLGSAFLVVLGFIYIEETAPKNTAPLYYGIILAMNGVGETLGLLAAWQFTKFPYTLTGIMELEDWSAGAWWLALPIIAGLFFIVPFPLLLFPKWISEPKWLTSRRRRHLKHWMGIMKQEDKLIKKIIRRQRRKKRKEEIAKRKKERAEKEAEEREAASPDDSGTVLETEDESLDGIRSAGRESHANRAYEHSTSLQNSDVVISDEARNGAGGSTRKGTRNGAGKHTGNAGANGHISPQNVDVEVHIGTTTTSNETVNQESDEESDAEEAANGQGLPEIQDSQDIPIEQQLDLEGLTGDLEGLNVDLEGLDKAETEPDAAPRRAVRFATDGAGEILIEEGMDVDDVLQMEEPPTAADADADSTTSDKKAEKEKQRRLLGRRIQDLPKNIWFLVNRPVYSLVLTGTLLAAYSPAGYQATLPAYVASQLPMYNPPGQIVAGIPYTVGLALGTLLSGCIMYKREWRLLIHIKMILVIQAIVTLLLLLAMAPKCDIKYFFDTPIRASDMFSLSETCSSRCDCTDAQFNPVCSETGVIFPSPCLAGCRTTSRTPENIMVHDQCHCLPDVELSSGFCNNSCYGATAGYGVLVFLISVLQACGQVNLLIICLRCIALKLRSLALGFAFCIVLLTAYVPGVAVFRALQGVACLHSEEDCMGDDICWHYNSNTYRYLYHGTAALFQLVSLSLYIAAFCVIRAKAKAVLKVTDASKVTDAASQGHDLDNATAAGEENKAFESATDSAFSQL